MRSRSSAIILVMMYIVMVPSITRNAEASPTGRFLPPGSTSVRVGYDFGSSSPRAWHHLPVLIVRLRSLLVKLRYEIGGQDHAGRAVRADSHLAGADCIRPPQIYWLRFRFPDHHPITFGVWCGWIEKQGNCSACGTPVTMALAYTLAVIERRITHARSLCDQRWHGYHLRLCRTFI